MEKSSLNVFAEEVVDENLILAFFYQKYPLTGQEKISKGQVEKIETSRSLISHLSSNRTICSPFDGKKDSREKTPRQKDSRKIRVRMYSVLRGILLYLPSRFLPPHILPPINRTKFSTTANIGKPFLPLTLLQGQF